MRDEGLVESAGAATPSLLGLGWLLTGDREQAQDVAQSALVRTYTSWSRIRNDDALTCTRPQGDHRRSRRRVMTLHRQGNPKMTHHPRSGELAGLLNAAVELGPANLGVNLGEIRRRGRRRNRARWAATACAGVVTAAAIAGTVSVTGTLPGTGGRADPTPHQVGAPAVPNAVRSAADPSPTEPSTNPPIDPPAGTFSDEPIGEVIKTDTAHSGGKLTLWFSESSADNGRLHLSLGARDAKGDLRSFGSAVATSRRPAGVGFKAAYDAINGDSEPRAYALVGIVVGDVSRVTLTVDGKPRTARVAAWSEDPQVHAWWVLGDKLDRWPGKSQPLRSEVSDLTAYGPDGKVIARGEDGDVAHG